MKILFDTCMPATLRRHFTGYEVILAAERGWEEYQNGDLLQVAQHEFDVIISVDTNIKYQQRLEAYEIGLIVLRSFRNTEPRLRELIPELLILLATIRPGEVVYLFTEEMKEIEKRRGREFKR